MSEHHPRDDSDLPLTHTALLYVLGQLDGGAADDFEKRLGEDQAAREAVCAAVERTALDRRAPLDRAYRRRTMKSVPSPVSPWLMP